jgi:hypothetical protein
MFYFTQEATEKTSLTPDELFELSDGCTPTEIKDSELLSVARAVGTKMDENEAMAFLFAEYDRNENTASWCPDRDSETIQYLYHNRSISELKTKFAFSVPAFEKYQSANELTEKLSKLGCPSYCDFQKPNEGNSFFRVRIGKYGSRAETDHVLTEIRKLGDNGFISQN